MNSKEPSAGGVRYTAIYTVPVGRYGGSYVQMLRFVKQPGQTLEEALNTAGYKTQKQGHEWDISEATVFIFNGWPQRRDEHTIEPEFTPKTADDKEKKSQAKPYIVCSAIRQKDTGAMVCGPRHYDGVMWSQILGIPLEKFVQLQQNNQLPDVDERHKAWQNAEEGFIDQCGRFYTREEAWDLVMSNGQSTANLDKTGKSGVLYSEHLYADTPDEARPVAKTEIDTETVAKARSVLCLLNAAMVLIGSVYIEGPRGENLNLAEDTGSISQQILSLQVKLMDIADGVLS